MKTEGGVNGAELAFFETVGFRSFNFALLQKLNAIEHAITGYSELSLQATDKKIPKKLQQSLTELTTVVATLQKLLELQRQYRDDEVSTVHPEILLHRLHSQFGWPKNSATTYRNLLVAVAENTLPLILAQLFELEKVPFKGMQMSFRRRDSSVVMRFFTPKFLWTKSSVYSVYHQKNFCTPQLSDSLEIILLRANLCILQKYHIELSITALQPQSLYVRLPSVRQLQAFAL